MLRNLSAPSLSRTGGLRTTLQGKSDITAIQWMLQTEYAAKDTPESVLVGLEDDRRLYEAFLQLSKVQRRRILMLAEGMSVNEIARREGVHHSVVSETIAATRKKLKKF